MCDQGDREVRKDMLARTALFGCSKFESARFSGNPPDPENVVGSRPENVLKSSISTVRAEQAWSGISKSGARTAN